MGFWGPLSYKYNKEPPNCVGNYLGPYSRVAALGHFHTQGRVKDPMFTIKRREPTQANEQHKPNTAQQVNTRALELNQ